MPAFSVHMQRDPSRGARGISDTKKSLQSFLPASLNRPAAASPPKPRMEVTPPAAEFTNYDVDTAYVMPLEVRNRTGEILTLRFVKPARHPGTFRLVNGASVRVAPGLAHTVEVEFTTHAPKDYEDVLVILSSDGGCVEVPLTACRVPLIEFPPTVSFGKVEQQLVCPMRTLTLVNRGRKDAAVTFVLDEKEGKGCDVTCGVALSSTVVTVPAESRTSVTLELKPLSPGLYTWHIPVEMNGQRLPHLLEVTAEVVDCRSRLFDPQTHKEVVSVEFAETFAGNKASHQLEVVNGGSQAISFAIRSAHDISEGGVMPFRFVPTQGRLPPQGRLTVTALFTPQLKVRRTGWSATPSNAPTETAEIRKYEALFSLLFVETEQTQTFRMVGTSCETLVRLSTSVVDFGTCVLKGLRESTLTVTNGVAHLPMRYALKCPPHFSVTPARGVVAGGGSATLRLAFRPRRLEPYVEVLTLTANNTVTCTVELRGTPLYREGAAAPATARSSGTEDEVAVPMAVDLGMIPAEGLTPPSLPRQVPAAVLIAEDTAMRSCRSGHVAPPVFDVHSLAKRRFHVTPTTAQERRDCKRELTPMEVLNIVLPSKSLDFGRVTIDADAVASLFVYNGTNACVQVSVPTEAEGPVTVEPVSQVVPARRMAQFDVHLRFGAIQSFQQVMRVTVNQQHYMRFSVLADVVPVEVTLSQTQVLLSLTGQAEEPVCTAQVALTNKGNCAAAYRWYLSSPSCEFEVEPQMGSLNAGEQRSATFYFLPAPGTSKASCEARLEVVGATEDKVLLLTGSVAPAKCVWGTSATFTSLPVAPGFKEAVAVSGVVALGRIAAGVPALAVLPITNKGSTNAYFSVGALPAWLSVSPSQGRVCAGETEELTVRVRHAVAGAVVHLVECNVAGMRRPLVARVEATVVAPSLSVELDGKEQGETHLDFGHVYVGCPQSRSVTLRNGGDVAAAVRVNLEACTYYSLDSAVLEEEGQQDILESRLSLSAMGEAQRSRLMPRMRSLRSLSVADRKLSFGVAAATVVVPPLAEYTLHLSFNPLRAAATQHCSVRWHQLGADDVHPLPPFTLEATALAPPVVLSATTVSFPSVVVGQRPPPQVVFVRHGDLSMPPSLPERRPVVWRLEMEDSTPSFLVEPHRGVLGVGEEHAVTITYLPMSAERVQTYVLLKTEGAESPTGAPCARCAISASATDPRVRSDRTSLAFPAVPLGVAVETTVLLHNEGYDAVRVEYLGSCDPPLQVSFPDGHSMGAVLRSTLPVTFTFCSPAPISVRSAIRLHTDAGGCIDIAISGSAVNSIITTEAFVSYMSLVTPTTITAGAAGEGDDTSYVLQCWASDHESVLRAELPMVCTLPSAMDGTHGCSHDLVDAVEESIDWEAERAWLTAWWNAFVCRTPVQNLVEALQATRGGIVGDMTYQFTGKRPRRAEALESSLTASTRVGKGGNAGPAATATIRSRKGTVVARGGTRRQRALEVANTPLSSSESTIPKELRTLHTLIQYVRSCGGCLRDVELPFLLPFDAFLEHTAAHSPSALERLSGVAEDEDLELVFERRATALWVAVMRECLRLFYVSQVRVTSATSAPPALLGWLSSSLSQRSLSRSNIYSEEESLLLRWVTACVETFASGDNADLHSSLSAALPRCFEDLRDGQALIIVVLTYVPFLGRQVREAIVSAEQQSCEAHAAVLLDLLYTLRIPGLPLANAFVAAPPTQVVLLLTHLFVYLPKFINTVPVSFHGRALTALTETVTVENTSSQPREYCVLLPDAPLFRANTDKLTVAPRSSTELTLSIIPRTRRPVTGQCLLVDCSSQVPPAERVPFVFQLKATPTMEPLQTVYMETPQYECLQSELHITNPFSVDCVVSLRVAQTRLPTATQKTDAGATPEVAAPWLDSDDASFWRHNHDAPFTVATEVLSLRRGEPTRLPFSFAPLSRGVYRLLLTFWEEWEGEFTWAVEATSGWPKPVDSNLELRVELGESCTSILDVKSSNPSLERCVKLYEDRAHNTQRTDLSRLLSGARYVVHFVNDRMEGPNPFFAASEGSYLAPTTPAATWPVTFTFKPQCVGVYRTYVLLMSEVDVRLLLVVGECVPRGDRRTLQFACPARQIILQQITLCNYSAAEDWLFAATFEGSAQFSGPHDVRVPSGRSKEYTIKYAPSWISEEETATLVLLNGITGQKHTYTLVGTAGAPLSEGILTLNCRARDHETLEMMVPNICSQDTTYFMKTDLMCCEGESSSLVIPRASSRRFALKATPNIGGDYSGHVTFTASNGRYVWYAVQLHVAPPEKEGLIELRTNVRALMVADVSVTNPLDTALMFKVHRYGAGLYGANTFQLAPKAAATYSLLFVPTQTGESTGRLSLVSEAAGEFWYELHMTVTETEPEPLPFPPTPIGQSQVMQVNLPNRSDVTSVLTVESTDAACFGVRPPRVVLPAHSESVVDLLFTPRCVGVEQTALVTLRNPELGCWRYKCVGTGTAPLAAEPLTCTCDVGTTATILLPFTNVLKCNTGVEVQLSGDTAAFALRTVPNGVVAAGASASLVVAFTPSLVKRHDAVVEVRPAVRRSDKTCDVTWTYPIEGYCVYRQTQPALRLRCASRMQCDDTVYVHAPGLTPGLAADFSVVFEADPQQSYAVAAAASVSCSVTMPSPYPDGFELSLKFTPLRPLVGSGWVVLRGAECGVWQYRVQLESTPAPVDDTIVLYGDYKESTSVSFDLYNVFPYRSSFFAYFTADSSKDFAVSPAHGVLLPFVCGQRGAATATNLQISAHPSSRIPQIEGTLVVDTDDMQWTFRVLSKFGHQFRPTN